jgi:hypothetical protein
VILFTTWSSKSACVVGSNHLSDGAATRRKLTYCLTLPDERQHAMLPRQYSGQQRLAIVDRWSDWMDQLSFHTVLCCRAARPIHGPGAKGKLLAPYLILLHPRHVSARSLMLLKPQRLVGVLHAYQLSLTLGFC